MMERHIHKAAHDALDRVVSSQRNVGKAHKVDTETFLSAICLFAQIFNFIVVLDFDGQTFNRLSHSPGAATGPERNVSIRAQIVLAGHQTIASFVSYCFFLFSSLCRSRPLGYLTDFAAFGKHYNHAIELGLVRTKRLCLTQATDFSNLLGLHTRIDQFTENAQGAMAGKPLVVIRGTFDTSKAVHDEL